MPVRVKICGVCSAADARAAVAAGADFLGLNFHAASPRYVRVEKAREIAEAVPEVTLVGVFVDAPRTLVQEIAAAVGLAMLQFHGDEEPAYCSGWRWQTIKALSAEPGRDLVAAAASYPTEYVLLDGHRSGVAGGTGVAFDPARARGVPARRLFVAGGLRPDTVGPVVRRLRPFAVDVASGVEVAPGVKDHEKVAEFIRRAKTA
jgi:phosphoribosylanthranilate isomerase